MACTELRDNLASMLVAAAELGTLGALGSPFTPGGHDVFPDFQVLHVALPGLRRATFREVDLGVAQNLCHPFAAALSGDSANPLPAAVLPSHYAYTSGQPVHHGGARGLLCRRAARTGELHSRDAAASVRPVRAERVSADGALVSPPPRVSESGVPPRANSINRPPPFSSAG